MVCEYLIDLENVSCKNGYKYLLRDVSWKVKPGEHWIVFGMNGSGKTTLLSIIAGFKELTSGIVKVFGQEFSNNTALEIRKKIGWVSSSFFDKHYTKESALDIVLSGKSGTLGLDFNITLDDVYVAKQLLEELKLGDKINYGFDTMSKGERQNVLIARALISNPEILILDEPCTGLDVYNRSYLFSTIEELARNKGITIIYVTHYLEEVTPLFSKALLLKNGRIFAYGNTKEIFTEQYMETLLEHPVMIEQNVDATYRMNIKTQSSLTSVLK